jgi:hypothetical protein
MSVVGIDHVLLAMPAGREDEARAFYTGVMLLQEKVKPAELAGRGGAWFTNGRNEVHRGVEKISAPPARRTRHSWCATYRALSRVRASMAARSRPTSRCPATTASSCTTRSATASS